ncbi:SymE family type I addiction module toxin [Erwinia sp.]|uniref:SymE family type I addiction module toxin n=1 Tax=Erwinia citreus TaxID=558 RepID=UPI00391706E2
MEVAGFTTGTPVNVRVMNGCLLLRRKYRHRSRRRCRPCVSFARRSPPVSSEN